MALSAPSEISPLLPKSNVTSYGASQPDNVIEQPLDGQSSSDVSDLERRALIDVPAKQDEGLPDVKKRMKYIFPALAIGVLLTAADQTIIASSYGKIGSDLNALNKTSWIATSYFLTLTSFQPLYGKLSDIFSRKSCLMVAYTIFGIGCLFCGLAANIDQLIAARAFAGIGGGGMSTVVSIIFSDAIPLKERGKWQGYINIIFATGASAGAPLGGILADSIGWRWAFLGQAPICLLALIAVYLLLHLPPNTEDLDTRAKLRRVDFLGAIFLIMAVLALLVGLDRGSNISWGEKATLIPLCGSAPLFAAFIFVEVKVAAEPFAPGHLIFSRGFLPAYLCNFFSLCGWMAALFYIPLHFQAVDSKTATQSGLIMIPAIFASVCGSLFAGFYMQRTGKYYWLTVIAYSSLCLGLIIIFIFSTLDPQLVWGMIAGMIVAGFSGGVGVTSSLIALISNASREDQAVVTACSYLFRSLGSVTGVSLSATVANSTLRELLRAHLNSGKDAEKIVEHVRRSLEYIKTLEPSLRDIVRHCYQSSTSAAFGLQVGFVLGSAICAWFIVEKPLTR